MANTNYTITEYCPHAISVRKIGNNAFKFNNEGTPMKNDKAKGEKEKKKKTARKCHAIQYLTNATCFITLSVTHPNLQSPFNLFIC